MYKLIHKAIECLGLHISYDTIQETLAVHPLYPSLSSISDSFDLWGIEHIIAKLSFDDIGNLDLPILSSLTNNKPILIVKITKKYVFFRDSKYRLRKFDRQSFIKSWMGVSIILQRANDSSQNRIITDSNHDNVWIIFIIAVLVLMLIGGIIICSFNWGEDVWLTTYQKVVLLVNNIAGIVICALLYMNKIHLSSDFINKLCPKGKYTDCNKVVNSVEGKSILFNYIIEIAAGYFTSAVVWLIFAPSSAHWESPLFIFFIASVPIIILSIALQLFYVKKICIICCAILLCLLINIFSIKVDNVFQGILFLKYTYLFLSLVFIYIVFGKAYNYRLKYYRLRRLNARINFDLNTIQAHLSSLRLKTPDRGLHWGNPNSKVELTAVVSMECKHCKKLVRELLWLKNIYTDLHYKIIFDIPYEQEDKRRYISYLCYLNEHDGSRLDAILNEGDYFRKQINSEERKIDIPDFGINEPLLEEQRIFIETAKITYVPSIFINGRQLSSHYSVEDVIPIVQCLSKL